MHLPSCVVLTESRCVRYCQSVVRTLHTADTAGNQGCQELVAEKAKLCFKRDH